MRSDRSTLTRRSVIVGASLFSVGCVGDDSNGTGNDSADDTEPGGGVTSQTTHSRTTPPMTKGAPKTVTLHAER